MAMAVEEAVVLDDSLGTPDLSDYLDPAKTPSTHNRLAHRSTFLAFVTNVKSAKRDLFRTHLRSEQLTRAVGLQRLRLRDFLRRQRPQSATPTLNTLTHPPLHSLTLLTPCPPPSSTLDIHQQSTHQDNTATQTDPIASPIISTPLDSPEPSTSQAVQGIKNDESLLVPEISEEKTCSSAPSPRRLRDRGKLPKWEPQKIDPRVFNARVKAKPKAKHPRSHRHSTSSLDISRIVLLGKSEIESSPSLQYDEWLNMSALDPPVLLTSTCDHCRRRFSSNKHSNLRAQFAAHFPLCKLNSSSCDKCGGEFLGEYRRELRNHVSRKLCHNAPVSDSFCCDGCGWSSGGRRQLKSHVEQCQPRNAKKTCQNCGSVFARMDILRRHLRRSVCQKPISPGPAPKTELQSPVKEDKTKHVARRDVEKRPREVAGNCDECGTSLSSISSLVRHFWNRHKNALFKPSVFKRPM